MQINELNLEVAKLFGSRPVDPDEKTGNKILSSMFGSTPRVLSENEAWVGIAVYDEGDTPRWNPINFSENFTEALKAAQKLVEKNGDDLSLEYYKNKKGYREWDCTIENWNANKILGKRISRNGAEAICLALIDTYG